MEEKNIQDMCLIKNMAHELGLTPLDIFMHWLEIGKVKDLALKISYEDGNAIELNLSSLGLTTDFNLMPQIVSPRNITSEEERAEVPPLSFEDNEAGTETPKDQSQITEEENADEQPKVEIISHTTSIKHGRICLKKGQKENVKVGSYVYTTGDILPQSSALSHVNVRGIVLSHTDEMITMIKHIGSNLTALTSVAQIKNGWRFLTYKECEKIARYKDKLNESLVETRRKQVDHSSILLYKDEGDLYGYNVTTRTIHKSLTDQSIIKERGFALFLAKDLRVV